MEPLVDSPRELMGNDLPGSTHAVTSRQLRHHPARTAARSRIPTAIRLDVMPRRQRQRNQAYVNAVAQNFEDITVFLTAWPAVRSARQIDPLVLI